MIKCVQLEQAEKKSPKTKIMHTWKTANYKPPHALSTFGPSVSPYTCFQKLVFYGG